MSSQNQTSLTFREVFVGEIYSQKVDISNIADDILPGVELIGNMAKVRCCYWNDWKGLVRENSEHKLQ